MPTVELLLQLPGTEGLINLGSADFVSVPRTGEHVHVKGHGGTVAIPVKEIVYGVPETNADVVAVLGYPLASQTINSTENHKNPTDEWHEIFEKANSYNNVMMLAGYAGIFAIWSFTKDFIDAPTSLTVAKYIGISLLVFVLYEIIGMLSRASVIAYNSHPKSVLRFLAINMPKLHVYTWFIAFPVTSICGLYSAFILLSEIFNRLPAS